MKMNIDKGRIFIWYLIALIDFQIPWCLRDASECIYKHVSREGDVEVAKPEELTAMAKHGLLKPKSSFFKKVFPLKNIVTK